MSKKKILVVVDYQNDFVSGALGFDGADKIDTKICAKMQEYLDNDDIVVVTYDTHTDLYSFTREGKALPVLHCIFRTDGWKLYGKVGELAEKNKDKIVQICKETFGVGPTIFNISSDFERKVLDYGGEDNIESVELCGLVTNMCVVSNAVVFQARFPEAQIIVDGTACDSFNKDLHNKTLDVLEGMQVKVIR